MANTKTILIVEDEEALLSALQEELVREGLKVLVARDGKKGLHVALQHHPDLILLDIVMTKMDGITMLKKLRKDSWGKAVPVILLTNLTDPDKVKEGSDSAVLDYLVKSNWSLKDVVAKVKEHLESV